MHPLETYLSKLAEIRASGAGTEETSCYPALDTLLNAVGGQLRPKVRCILQLKNRGAGNPDGRLYIPEQFQKLTDEEPLAGQRPARGAIEVKPVGDDAWVTADSEQVSRYWKDMARRIAAICLLQPRLDANYAAVKANTYAWPGG